MRNEEIMQLLQKGPILLDGATGTNLQKAGMPTGVCPEQWVLEHKEVLRELQEGYWEAGSQIVLVPTFTGNRIKLAEYGLEDQVEEINQQLVHLSKEVANGRGYIAADLSMTGEQLYPMGELLLEELIDVYKEQVSYLAQAGVDLFVVETMMSLAEARAAVLAVKETCDLPVIVSMTYNEDGRTLYGTDPITAAVVLEHLGVSAIGLNCSTGPEEMIGLIEQFRDYTSLPILAKPNAGLPKLVQGQTVYDMTPEEFAYYGEQLVEAGASIIGGCCGTTPAHIKALHDQVAAMPVRKHAIRNQCLLASERKTIAFDPNSRFLVIGERINPTGKKKLQAELREGSMDLVLDMAEEQEVNGAAILDINMGMNGIDEKEKMLEVIHEVGRAVNLPLCIDSSHVDVIEAALRIYPGRALINSISLETEKFTRLLPIARKYGAMFILLPLSDAGLPENLEAKKKIIHTIVEEALRLGFTKEDMIVDGLVATVGANKMAAVETIETIRYCKEELGLCTVCGLSNISFGLPARPYVNTAFLVMAIQAGLTMAIANPSQELLINAAAASDLLINKEGADLAYIRRIQSQEAKQEGNSIAGDQTTTATTGNEMPKVYEYVLKGNKASILNEVRHLLQEKQRPETIIDEMLIPAINEVGRLFDKQIYFLPQLISSAEAMKTAIEYLEPMIQREEDGTSKATIVMATVEGDIHDIGKNLVVLMLKNYGYRVIDLGKDVSKEVILQTAVDERADIIGLSALMTTTMMRMKEVVDCRNERQINVKIIIGGAVITESFAQEIGADGFSKDAADAVSLVKHLMKEE